MNHNTHHLPPPLASLLTLSVVTVSCSQHLFTATALAHYQPSYQLHDSQPHLSLSVCKFTEIQPHKKMSQAVSSSLQNSNISACFFFFFYFTWTQCDDEETHKRRSKNRFPEIDVSLSFSGVWVSGRQQRSWNRETFSNVSNSAYSEREQTYWSSARVMALSLFLLPASSKRSGGAGGEEGDQETSVSKGETEVE